MYVQDGTVQCRRLDLVLLARQHMHAATTTTLVTSTALASLTDHLPVAAIVTNPAQRPE